MANKITVSNIVHAPLENVWEMWNTPSHIEKWAFASDDWEATNAENDLREGGTFKTHMGAKDGSTGFDFSGVYTEVVPHQKIAYTMDDGRTVVVEFESVAEGTKITETFEAEQENTEEVQKEGWQSILDNFKKHVEANGE